jgi:SAM-dependent methyltransferase
MPRVLKVAAQQTSLAHSPSGAVDAHLMPGCSPEYCCVVTARAFLVRASASAGYHLTRVSTRLQTGHATQVAATDTVNSSNSSVEDVVTQPNALGGRQRDSMASSRNMEWPWTLAHLRSEPGRVLDFGSGNGFIALGAAFAGKDVVAVDLQPEQWSFGPHRIEYVQGDFNELEFETNSFDQILNCSSVEHVGLAGRYGATDDPDGDLRVMEKLARLLKPGGDMVLTIPVGLDAVIAPLHRIYGEKRLPLLLAHWQILKESYWAQLTDTRYEQVTREQALADPGSETYWALGLYVLGPR